MRPRIYGLLEREPGAKAGVILMHPASNFMNYHMVRALSERGIACMGLNNRYVNNDFRAIDGASNPRFGCRRQMVAHPRLHQSCVALGILAEQPCRLSTRRRRKKLTVQATPAGDPVPLTPGDLPPVDGLVFCAAHAGRSRLLLEWIDPSLTDEGDAASRDPSLDMYDTS